MQLNELKDQLFDLINESDRLNVMDIEACDREDYFFVTMQDGSRFKLICKAL